jgi:hypothetical protein
MSFIKVFINISLSPLLSLFLYSFLSSFHLITLASFFRPSLSPPFHISKCSAILVMPLLQLSNVPFFLADPSLTLTAGLSLWMIASCLCLSLPN